MQFQHHNITSDKLSNQNNERFYHVKQTVENRQKNHILSNFRGGARRVRHLDPPLGHQFRNLLTLIVENWSKFWYYMCNLKEVIDRFIMNYEKIQFEREIIDVVRSSYI
jgi:hypothetical protein